MHEETGYVCRVIGTLTEAFKGTLSSISAFFLMEPISDQGTFSNETAQTRWVDSEEARVLINLTQDSSGVSQDLKILDEAQVATARLKPAVHDELPR